MLVRVLCAVEPASLRRRMEHLLEQIDSCFVSVAAGVRSIDKIDRQDADLVVVSDRLIPKPVGQWVTRVRQLPENPEVVVLYQEEDPKLRAALLRDGCLAVLYAGLKNSELGDTLQSLVQRRREEALRLLKARAPASRCSLDDFVSQSPSMSDFMRVARRVVRSTSFLLILGETGTGKERLARAIHEEGPRAAGPFLAVNCGALPESLLESELFGHERGAFTGASRARRGYFEQASGGTLFLDEIGEVPMHLQVKLLRVLEEKRIRRLGSEGSFPIDVRIMAATNRDLEQEAKAGRFRPDLYYRLAVVTLSLPSLRDRREDIPALVESYLEYFRSALGHPIRGIRPEALKALVAYDWPGNVRELINVTERAVLLGAGPMIELADLPASITGAAEQSGTVPARVDRHGPLAIPANAWIELPIRHARSQVVSAFERSYLSELLRSTRGSVRETARKAGINERSLYDLMKRHRLRKEAFKLR